MNLMDAIGGIGDEYIEEFADVKPRKKLPLWVKIVPAAACAVILAVTVPSVSGFLFGNSRELSSSAGEINNAHAPGAPTPFVVTGSAVYTYADEFLERLPDGYELIGEVTGEDYSDYKTEGNSAGCKIGDKIYKNPELPNEIYVYTRLFNGEKYRYILFKDFEKS